MVRVVMHTRQCLLLQLALVTTALPLHSPPIRATQVPTTATATTITTVTMQTTHRDHLTALVITTVATMHPPRPHQMPIPMATVKCTLGHLFSLWTIKTPSFITYLTQRIIPSHKVTPIILFTSHLPLHVLSWTLVANWFTFFLSFSFSQASTVRLLCLHHLSVKIFHLDPSIALVRANQMALTVQQLQSIQQLIKVNSCTLSLLSCICFSFLFFSFSATCSSSGMIHRLRCIYPVKVIAPLH